MSDLAEFLLARIADDEADAAKFAGTAYAQWHFEPDPDPGRIGGRVVGTGQHAEVANDWSSPYNPAAYIGVSAHIARHDPARVLAECAAKRLIVEYAEQHPMPCRGSDFDTGQAITLAVTLRYLAQPYSGHPGFRSEWTV